MTRELTESHLQDWNDRVQLAEAALPLIGRLFRERSVIATMFGRPLIEKSPIDILREHRYVRQVEESELSIRDTYPLLQEAT